MSIEDSLPERLIDKTHPITLAHPHANKVAYTRPQARARQIEPLMGDP